MSRRARWIRLGAVDRRALQAACDGFSVAPSRVAAPIVLWGNSGSPPGELTQEDERGYLFAVVAPAHFAPGLAARWVSWALSPAVAACRDFGLRAYLDGCCLCLHGRRVGGGRAEAIGEWVVVTANLDLGGSPVAQSMCAPEFRAWLREGLGLAMTQWRGEGDAPPERAFEAALRARIEAQHGWQFETAWPMKAEQAVIDGARREFVGSITATG